jgi:hypothetical protein
MPLSTRASVQSCPTQILLVLDNLETRGAQRQTKAIQLGNQPFRTSRIQLKDT